MKLVVLLLQEIHIVDVNDKAITAVQDALESHRQKNLPTAAPQVSTKPSMAQNRVNIGF